MPLNSIGHIYDMAEDTNPKQLCTLPLSVQLKIEKDKLFGKGNSKPRGKVKRLTTGELYDISERISHLVATEYGIDINFIYQRKGLPRYLAIAICYTQCKFTMDDIAEMFNCERKLAIIAARHIRQQCIIDRDFNTLYNNLLDKVKA